MNEPIELDPTEFFDFVDLPGPAVLFLSVHTLHPFNPLLHTHFGEEDGAEVAFGRLPLLGLFESASPALSFLHGESLACGASLPLAVPPGYYLFQRSRMLAWDSGVPATADVKRIVRGSLLGAAVSLFTRDPSFVGRALLSAAEEAVAERIAFRFRSAATAHRENPRRASAGPRTASDDLANAYRLLQVDPAASDAEVNRAWRALQRKYHPDRAAQDPDEFDRLSHLCVEINLARDTVRNHRRQARRRTAAA